MDLPPIPKELFDTIDRVVRDAHYDENAGVPIGARSLAFAILDNYADAPKNAFKLNLGSYNQLPTEWAADNCLSTIRRFRDPS